MHQFTQRRANTDTQHTSTQAPHDLHDLHDSHDPHNPHGPHPTVNATMRRFKAKRALQLHLHSAVLVLPVCEFSNTSSVLVMVASAASLAIKDEKVSNGSASPKNGIEFKDFDALKTALNDLSIDWTDLTEDQLELLAPDDMHCSPWGENKTVTETFKNRDGGAIMANQISKYYFRKRGHVQPVFSDPAIHGAAFGPWAQEQTTPWGILLCRRAPDNNRNECVSRSLFQDGMYVTGYNLEGRSPMILFAVPEELKWTKDPRSRLVYGAATCYEAWVDAKRAQSDNAQINITIKTGFLNCIDLRGRTTSEIRRWCCLEWNKHQSGSGWNVQQHVDMFLEYKNGFKKHCHDNKWTKDSFGTGPASRDSRCWEWLKSTYQASGDMHCVDINHYNQTITFLNQMHDKQQLAPWLAVIAQKCDHRHPRFDCQVYMKIGYTVEVALRCQFNGEDALTTTRSKIFLQILLRMGLPLINDPSSHFVWSSAKDVSKLTKVMTQTAMFKPKPVAALLKATTSNTSNAEKAKTTRRKKKDSAEENAADSKPSESKTVRAGPS